MRDHHTYDYAVIRVVPRVDREEFVNAGVIVSCPALAFLGARVLVDGQRLGVHSGWCRDPTDVLQHLLRQYVAVD